MTFAIALDVHAHLIPASTGRLEDFDGVRWDAASQRLVIDEHTVGLAKLFSADELLRWMDEFGVETAWVSPPPPTYRPQLDAGTARDWANRLHDGLLAMTQGSAGRLRVMRFLPVEHPGVAAELVGAGQAGRPLFTMSTGGPGIVLSDDRYEPLWQALHEAGATIFLHPGEGCDGRLDRYYLGNLLGNPSETGLAIAHLVHAGVIARYPRIDFLVAHGGGTAPMLAGRWERGFDTDRPGIDKTIGSPARQLAHIRCDCITHSAPALAAAFAAFGGDAVVFGSDWPFPMGLIDPHRQLAILDPVTRAQVLANSRSLAACDNNRVPESQELLR